MAGRQVLAADHGDWGFTAFALAGVSSTVFIGIAALRSARPADRNSEPRKPVPAHWADRAGQCSACGAGPSLAASKM
ncbi:hypothetical protein [Streptomyces sp. Ru71]|uniref:hypothetical protein n=1 Tax=Streptomyces sp. Ru71 TaxID=2080746 RepID=UPI0021564C0B|nr:hypothetical protein [Streptomyces sp. Ru71]